VHLFPLRAGRPSEAFEAAQDDSAAELPLTIVRQGAGERPCCAGADAARQIETVFCDALRQEDLEALAQAILCQPSHYLPVGSPGWRLLWLQFFQIAR